MEVVVSPPRHLMCKELRQKFNVLNLCKITQMYKSIQIFKIYENRMQKIGSCLHFIYSKILLNVKLILQKLFMS